MRSMPKSAHREQKGRQENEVLRSFRYECPYFFSADQKNRHSNGAWFLYLYKAFEDKGKVGLVFQVDNCEVYALTWDDIFKSFEIKHKPMLERLKYDRERVANELMAEVSDTEGREKADTLTKIAVAEVL